MHIFWPLSPLAVIKINNNNITRDHFENQKAIIASTLFDCNKTVINGRDVAFTRV